MTPEVLVNGDQWALVRERVDLAEVFTPPLPGWLG